MTIEGFPPSWTADPQLLENSSIVREMRTLRRLIDEARELRSLEPMLRYLYRAIERDTPAQLRDDVACGPGCAWCCHTRVCATAPEIIYLAGTGAAHLPDDVTARVPLRAQERRSGWKQAWHPIACAVLEDGLCTAHPRRPVACRTAVSFDAMRCREAIGDPDKAIIPTDLSSIALRAAYDIAFQGALLNAGYGAERYDLATGLADAVTRSDAEIAWLSGAQVFSSALRIEDEPFLQSPVRRALYEAAFG